MSAAVWFYFARVLTQRVDTLVANIRALAAGRLDACARLGGSDEIAQLGEAFNRMAADLQAHGAALRESEARFRAIMADSAPV